MLLRLKPNFDYGEYFNEKLIAGALYVAFAIEVGEQKMHVYINMSMDESFPYDICHFDLKDFEIVDGNLPDDWKMTYLEEFNVYITSYPEWLTGEYYIDAHDYNLLGDDGIISKYQKIYEQQYIDMLLENREELGILK